VSNSVCSHEGITEASTTSAGAATHQVAKHCLHAARLLDGLLKVLFANRVDLVVKSWVTSQLASVVLVGHLLDKAELADFDALNEGIDEVENRGLLLGSEEFPDGASLGNLGRFDEHLKACTGDKKILLGGVPRLHDDLHGAAGLLHIPRLEEKLVSAGM